MADHAEPQDADKKQREAGDDAGGDELHFRVHVHSRVLQRGKGRNQDGLAGFSFRQTRASVRGEWSVFQVRSKAEAAAVSAFSMVPPQGDADGFRSLGADGHFQQDGQLVFAGGPLLVDGAAEGPQ